MATEINLAEMFLRYDYAEAKDLAKSFLTLNSGILVFSIAFSEKVIEYRTASMPAKLAMVGSWALGILAIILSGAAICCLAVAAGFAVYGGDFFGMAQNAYILLLLAGASFVTSLIALVASAVLSMRARLKDAIASGSASASKAGSELD